MNSSNATVEVLLATYNGERFLREQIDSVLSQTYRNLAILARDDGSSDGTSAILQEYAIKCPDRFRVLPTDTPTGSAPANFLRLLSASTAPYVCFCDQDDVWVPEKVELCMRAMEQLERKHGRARPLLVFTDLVITDRNLEPKHPSLWRYESIRPKTIFELRQLVGKNVVTGSTALLNRPLADLARSMPSDAPMHDRWVALLANLFGSATWLPTPTVHYRQHERNVVGAVARAGMTQVPALHDHTERAKVWDENTRQAAAMLRIHGDELPAAARQLLETYVRCGEHPNRLIRVLTMLRHRFFVSDLRSTLSMLWYMWDKS